MAENPKVEVDEEEVFRPREFVQGLDDFFSEIFGEPIGFSLGVAYAGLTIFLWVAVAYGISAIMNSSEIGFGDSLSVSVIAFTVGSLLLAGGSSLANHFNKLDMNFNKYIYTSILFISSGIIFLVAGIFTTLHNGMPDIFLVTYLIGATGYWLNIIGAIVVSSALWTMLKLIWRLWQLVSIPESERDYVEKEYVGAGHLIQEIYPFMILGSVLIPIELAKAFSTSLVLMLLFLILWVIPLSWHLYRILKTDSPFYNLAKEIWKGRYTILFFVFIGLISVYQSYITETYGLGFSNLTEWGLWQEVITSEGSKFLEQISQLAD
jgi:hypothetical protein